MAAVEDSKLFSELLQGSEPAAAAAQQTIDLSFIHWGYLNSTLVTDQSKKSKELTWKTYWVDLCGSTLRLYRDLSLNPESGNYPPPSKVVGPTSENEKKEAFLVLKKGASIIIPKDDEFRPRKRSKKTDPPRNNVFKLQVINSINSPVYFFEAPSKGSMYRWISKIEEGIDIADSPQNQFASDNNKLKEAKLLALESRRLQNVAPELKYSDTKDDTDSGMEGDVEENCELQEKPPPDPRLERLLKQLQSKEQQLEMLEKGEKAFVGNNGELSKVCEFKATTKADYYLVPGYPSALIPKASTVSILGQLTNGRWRCYVDLPKNLSNSATSDLSDIQQDDTTKIINSSETLEQSTSLPNSTLSVEPGYERILGSVPTSLLLELDEQETQKNNGLDLSVLPVGTPDVTPNISPYPSPPPSPYSPHKSFETSKDSPGFVRRSPTNLQRFVPSMDLSDVDAWEQFVIPSPPSTPVTSRSTTPSLSPSESLETLDTFDQTEDESGLNTSDDRTCSAMSNDVPVTIIGSVPDNEGQDEGEGEKRFNPVDTSSPVPPVVMRHRAVEALKPSTNETPKNYSFLVTKKLRQRGISLIVGSSSSEDEDDEDDVTTAAYKSKITRRKLDEELERFAAENIDKAAASVRPYSAFVPRKGTCVNFGQRPKNQKNVNLRTATTADLLRDYSSSNLTSCKTCVTLASLQGEPSSPENVPPINQRRTIQMQRDVKGGFGFTLQTYGIVQQNGEVEYMTFVLGVEEDGPAYMAGMRPGDIIIAIENRDVEEADHKTLVNLLQKAPSTVRMVVVFVDAIRRMHMNTKIKVLKTELRKREDEFKHLCKREREILTRSGDPSMLAVLDLDVFSPERSDSESYLYTTELTSSFSKDTTKVKDTLVKYRQDIDDKPRRSSLPDHSELAKQRLVSTTGTQLLRSFASSAESILKKSASLKLKKKVQKTKQTSQTFKSYLELDANGGHGPIESSSPKRKDLKRAAEPSTRLSWPRNSAGRPSVGQDDSFVSVFAESGRTSVTFTRQDLQDAPTVISFSRVKADTPHDQNEKSTTEDRPSSPGDLLHVVANTPKTIPQERVSGVPSPGESNVEIPHKDENSVEFPTGVKLRLSNDNKAEQKLSEILQETKSMAAKVTDCGDNIGNREPWTSTQNELLTASTSTVTPSKTERSFSHNIANLCKLFEVQSLPPSVSSKVEESDIFPTDYHNEATPKRPELTRTRLGSRPVSYMCAMDSAEQSPLIPDDVNVKRQKKDELMFESSA